ncbi:hypothetical protein HYH03_001676 [Edaphochlamys debaryana]|uniref:Uncharacterized protein n=1 Tax=Edaphochlamys debaryana TaxID=47281 RepID=A0A835YK70_9CHLO|nr:hypothetical protein HYH03_001676 [Edaphochlamys debaryana]|eukprot:KAG2500090.1 hypothetical protein HYH03_001676 [Edaphochlamys debaryana]
MQRTQCCAGPAAGAGRPVAASSLAPSPGPRQPRLWLSGPSRSSRPAEALPRGTGARLSAAARSGLARTGYRFGAPSRAASQPPERRGGIQLSAAGADSAGGGLEGEPPREPEAPAGDPPSGPTAQAGVEQGNAQGLPPPPQDVAASARDRDHVEPLAAPAAPGAGSSAQVTASDTAAQAEGTALSAGDLADPPPPPPLPVEGSAAQAEASDTAASNASSASCQAAQEAGPAVAFVAGPADSTLGDSPLLPPPLPLPAAAAAQEPDDGPPPAVGPAAAAAAASQGARAWVGDCPGAGWRLRGYGALIDSLSTRLPWWAEVGTEGGGSGDGSGDAMAGDVGFAADAAQRGVHFWAGSRPDAGWSLQGYVSPFESPDDPLPLWGKAEQPDRALEAHAGGGTMAGKVSWSAAGVGQWADPAGLWSAWPGRREPPPTPPTRSPPAAGAVVPQQRRGRGRPRRPLPPASSGTSHPSSRDAAAAAAMTSPAAASAAREVTLTPADVRPGPTHTLLGELVLVRAPKDMYLYDTYGNVLQAAFPYGSVQRAAPVSVWVLPPGGAQLPLQMSLSLRANRQGLGQVAWSGLVGVMGLEPGDRVAVWAGPAPAGAAGAA